MRQLHENTVIYLTRVHYLYNGDCACITTVSSVRVTLLTSLVGVTMLRGFLSPSKQVSTLTADTFMSAF